MSRINILNKQGFLSDEDRKQPLEHGCEYFTFKSCLDLSKPIQVIPYGQRNFFTIDEYSTDLAIFITWWSKFVLEDLNGFAGFHNVKFEFVNFTIKD
jgi:hypothetical protein